MSGAPARPGPGLEPSGPPGHWPQDPGHLRPREEPLPDTSVWLPVFRVLPLPHSPGSGGARGPQGAGQTALLALLPRSRLRLLGAGCAGTCEGPGPGVRLPGRCAGPVPLEFPAHQRPGPRIRASSLRAGGARGQVGAGPPSPAQCWGVRRVPELRGQGVPEWGGSLSSLWGGWGPALGHLPGAFRAECR